MKKCCFSFFCPLFFIAACNYSCIHFFEYYCFFLEYVVTINIIVSVVPPHITRKSERSFGNKGETANLTFMISNAIPMVDTSNIRWYYTTSAPAGVPNFNSTDFLEITNLMNRTANSRLRLSTDRLTLFIINIVQAIGNSMETDQGRYFIRASNPAGDVSNSIDLVVSGKLTRAVVGIL